MRSCALSEAGRMGKLMGRIASSIVWLVCACRGCPPRRRALARRVSFGGSTLTVLAEPWDVAIRISRRDLSPDGKNLIRQSIAADCALSLKGRVAALCNLSGICRAT